RDRGTLARSRRRTPAGVARTGPGGPRDARGPRAGRAACRSGPAARPTRSSVLHADAQRRVAGEEVLAVDRHGARDGQALEARAGGDRVTEPRRMNDEAIRPGVDAEMVTRSEVAPVE